MRRPVAVFIALMLQVAACAAEDWEVLKPEGLGFAVSFPAAPDVKEDVVDVGDGRKAKTWTYTKMILSENAIYDITIAEYPDGAIDSNALEQALDNARDGGLSDSGGTLKTETKIQIDGRPARELLVDLMGMVSRSRIVIDGNRLFIVGAITSKNAEASAASEKYFASFKLSGGKPASSDDAKKRD